ncbi:MAG: response regulator [Actinomycetota bacterium]|nr:response regulator [Actinomycetota bacterium]
MESGRNLILVVDDDAQMCTLLTTVLEEHGYQCVAATSAKDARAWLERLPVALILCDVNMPGESGFALLREVRAGSDNPATVMVSGVDEPEIADFALSLGAYGYLTKPFRRNDLVITAANALRRRELELAERARRGVLEDEVARRTEELARALGEVRLAQQETITRLARAAEYRDRDTGAHVERVSHASAVIAAKLGLEPAHSELIHLAAPLHDIGKIGFPDSIFASRSSTLRPHERRLVEAHTTVGWEILSGSRSELLDLAATIAYTHHERFDGTGYPRGLAGEEIPLEGRIVAAADVFDAVTHNRSYQRTLRLDEALDVMRSKRGNHFDPHVLDAFFTSVEEIVGDETGRLVLHPKAAGPHLD